MATDFLSQSSAVRIRILEGPLSKTTFGTLFGGGQGEVLLSGRMLPYKSLSFEVTQREKTTWSPGNPVATQQVFGAIESPSVINGIWKDTFLGNGVAKQLDDLFRLIAKSGSLLEFQWGDGNIQNADGTLTARSPYIRRGILKRFKSTPTIPQDVTWEAEFRWRGEDQDSAPPTFNLGQINPGQALNEATDIFQNTNDAVLGFTQSPLVQFLQFPQTIQTQFNEALDSAETGILELNSVIETIPSTAKVALDVANRITGLLDLVRSSFDAFQGTLLDIKAESMITTDQGTQELVFLSDRLNLLQGIDVAKAQAIDQQNQVDGMILPNIMAEVRPPAGTDLRALALQYYGDPDSWWIIAQANNLSSSRVPNGPTGPSDNPGAPLRIPSITQSPISDLTTAVSADGT